jgi:UDPglucose 6-dehydrogenase
MKVAVIGAGYVGLTTGAVCAYLGNDVTCVEMDPAKVAFLRDGHCPIYEPGLTQLMEHSKERLRFTTNYDEAIPDACVVFIAVGTPYTDQGPNMEYVGSAATQIGLSLSHGYTLIVNKSTVPIGSGNWVESLVRDAFESRNGHKPDGDFGVASNPEFLKEGTALADTLYPDRIVIGSKESRAIELLSQLYRPIINQDFSAPSFLPRPTGTGAVPLITTDLASAELIKYSANAFLTVKIGFINEMANLAEKVGADVLQIAKGIGLDSRIGTRFLSPGLGWGGSCFGKDTAALVSTAGEYGVRLGSVEAARDANCRQRERVIEKLQDELKILKGRQIGLLGLAFKPHTDDLRDAPSLDIARRLVSRGAKVVAHDPIALDRARKEAQHRGLDFVDRPEAVFNNSDCVVLVTEWPEYQTLPYRELAAGMNNPLFLDGRNFLDARFMSEQGYRYVGFGR